MHVDIRERLGKFALSNGSSFLAYPLDQLATPGYAARFPWQRKPTLTRFPLLRDYCSQLRPRALGYALSHVLETESALKKRAIWRFETDVSCTTETDFDLSSKGWRGRAQRLTEDGDGTAGQTASAYGYSLVTENMDLKNRIQSVERKLQDIERTVSEMCKAATTVTYCISMASL